MKQWVTTTQEQPWMENGTAIQAAGADTLELTGERAQTIEGFGGCFNELGWIALQKLPQGERDRVLQELFSQEGCNFNFCRLPIGASDYAAEWYSHNEHDGDYRMEHFSLERDYQYLIPYIKAAKALQPELELFASPWSPPTWMKFPKAYNSGRLRMEPEVLEAYALYFKKFVEAYKAEGLPIKQVHIQNEPFADQKFPSCVWDSEQFRVFIRDYIGPLFEKEGMDTEIWLGTLNGPPEMSFGFGGMSLNSYTRYLDNILFDEEARKYIAGVGYQWAGQHVIAKTRKSFPELRLMQTENECGEGRNSWEYAEYIFNLVMHYLQNSVTAYTYWNMVLEPGGTSTWGWHQNAMVTAAEGKAVLNPEFYVMKHYAHFIKPGAVMLGTRGHWSATSCAVENPDGSIVVLAYNALDRERLFTYKGPDGTFGAALPPRSFHTFVI